jgi:hypothetical protein
MAGTGFVDLLTGTNDDVNMTGGTLDSSSGVTGIVLNGANDTIGMGSSDTINLTGSGDFFSGGSLDSAGIIGSNDTISLGTGGYVEASVGWVSAASPIACGYSKNHCSASSATAISPT